MSTEYNAQLNHLKDVITSSVSVAGLLAFFTQMIETAENPGGNLDTDKTRIYHEALVTLLKHFFNNNEVSLSIEAPQAFLDACKAIRDKLYDRSVVSPALLSVIRKYIKAHWEAIEAALKHDEIDDRKKTAKKIIDELRKSTSTFHTAVYTIFWNSVAGHAATLYFLRCLCPGSALVKISHSTYLFALGLLETLADRLRGIADITPQIIVQKCGSGEINKIGSSIIFSSENSAPAPMVFDPSCIAFGIDVPTQARFLTRQEAATLQQNEEIRRLALADKRPLSTATDPKASESSGYHKQKEIHTSSRQHKTHSSTPFIHQHQQQHQQHQQQQNQPFFPAPQQQWIQPQYNQNAAVFHQPPPANTASAAAPATPRGCARCRKFLQQSDDACIQLIRQNSNINNAPAFLQSMKNTLERHHSGNCGKFTSDTQTIPSAR